MPSRFYYVLGTCREGMKSFALSFSERLNGFAYRRCIVNAAP